jgi:hypothetical protein
MYLGVAVAVLQWQWGWQWQWMGGSGCSGSLRSVWYEFGRNWVSIERDMDVVVAGWQCGSVAVVGWQ